MDILPLARYSQDSIDSMLASIPFYRLVQQEDQWQYDVLMNHSRFIEFRPGEVVVEKDQEDKWLFFLLKGLLQVIVGSGQDARVVNHITPGEVFGDIAILLEDVRSANVIADSNSKRVLVFATDFTVFGELSDTNLISLRTKLIYYRNMVHNLRWKLEMYRTSYPEHKNASLHRKIKLYAGAKDCFEELLSLDAQAHELAKLLIQWNQEFDSFDKSLNSPVTANTFAQFDK